MGRALITAIVVLFASSAAAQSEIPIDTGLAVHLPADTVTDAELARALSRVSGEHRRFHLTGDRMPRIKVGTLKHSGRDLSPRDTATLLTPKAVLGVIVGGTVNDAGRLNRRLEQAMYDLAKAHGGAIEDIRTREYFSVQGFATRRLNAWQGDVADAEAATTIHLYADKGHHRAVTLGMERFGLPNVVVEGIPATLGAPVGRLMVLVCQTLVEGGIPTQRGFAVDIRKLKHRAAAKRITEALEAGATQTGQLAWVFGTPEKGDTPPLIQLTFSNQPGQSLQQRMAAQLKQTLGHTGRISLVPNE
ncbi:MAG: hypothetical protein ACI9WU_000726 [Myxococcota bacterium]|jgi:hypothetical protein